MRPIRNWKLFGLDWWGQARCCNVKWGAASLTSTSTPSLPVVTFWRLKAQYHTSSSHGIASKLFILLSLRLTQDTTGHDITSPLNPTCFLDHSLTPAMSNSTLDGLRLTKSERLIVVTLSYLFCAPVIWSTGRKLSRYLFATWQESRRQVREEREQRQRGNAPN